MAALIASRFTHGVQTRISTFVRRIMRTSACQVQKSRDGAARARPSVAAAARPTARGVRDPSPGPLPDEALDALVAVLDEVRLGRSQSRGDLVAATGLSPRRRRPARRRAPRPRAGRRGRCRARAPAAGRRASCVPGRRRPRPGRRPRRDQHRRRGHHARRPDPRPPSTSRPTSRTGRRSRWTAWRSCSTSCRAHAPRLPGRLWGIGIGVPGPVEFRHRPADLAADHARLGRLPGPRAVRGPLRRAGLGRQRRQRPRARRVAVRRRGGPRQRRSWSRSGPGIGAGIISDGRLHRGAQGSAGDVGPHPGLGRPRPWSAAAATSAASRRWRAARRSRRDGEAAARDGRSLRLRDGAGPRAAR